MDTLEKLIEINKNYHKYHQYQHTFSFAMQYYSNEIEKILRSNSLLFLIKLPKLKFYMQEMKRVNSTYLAIEYWFYLWKNTVNKEMKNDI